MKLYHHILLTTIFAVIILAGLFGTIFNWDFYEASRENRKLASFPDVRHTRLADIPVLLDAYVNDHFGYRNTYIRRYRKAMRAIGAEDFRVLTGKDNWLYLNDDSIMQDFIGAMPLDGTQLQERFERLRSRKEWLAQQGISYLFVLVPNKSTIYPEHLPSRIEQQRAKTNREAFVEKLPEDLAQHVLDLTPYLLQAKENAEVYHPADTHWSPPGSYEGYINIVSRSSSLLSQVLPILSRDQLVRNKLDYTGDLANMTLTPKRYAIETEFLLCPDKHLWSTNEVGNPAFLTPENIPINHKAPHVICNPQGTFNVVVFHDSFSERLYEYLPYGFKNTTFIWRYTNNSLLPLAVDQLKPDLVIEEVVERFLFDNKAGALTDAITGEADKRPDGL